MTPNINKCLANNSSLVGIIIVKSLYAVLLLSCDAAGRRPAGPGVLFLEWQTIWSVLWEIKSCLWIEFRDPELV